MRPEDIPAEVVERAAFVAYAYTGCCVDCPDQQTRAEAEEDAATAARHILAAVWGEIQARTLEEAADRLEAYVTGKANVPDDDRWTIDIGYHGEAAWLRAEAKHLRGES